MQEPSFTRRWLRMRTGTWGTLARLFAGSRRVLLASTAVSIAQAALLLPVALIVRRVFDTLVPQGDEGAIATSGLIVFVLYMASAALGLLTAQMVLTATRSAITQLRGELIERVVAFPRAWFDRSQMPKLQSTIVQDSDRVDAMANVLVGRMLPAATVAAGLSAILLVLNPLLFAALAVVVPAMVVGGRLVGRGVRTKMRELQRTFDAFSAGTQRVLGAITL